MTKRGDAATIALAIIYTGWGATILAGAILQSKHIVKKANERCIAYGGSVSECNQMVTGMSKTKQKEYIRDTVNRPQPANEPLGG